MNKILYLDAYIIDIVKPDFFFLHIIKNTNKIII